VGIAGLGAVGRVVAQHVTASLPAYHLTAVSAKRVDRARDFLGEISAPDPVEIVPIGELAHHADLVVECAPAAVFPEVAEPVLAAGRRLVVLSAGALLDSWELVDHAERHGGEILVPSGALLGLDAVQGVAQGRVHSVRMTTRKPLRGLEGAPYLVERGIDLTEVAQPIKLFEGTAREAFTGFPANLNVAVALSLAGIGPDRTLLEVWADPDLDRNTHHITVESDSARLELSISNVPSENPKTGRLTALSVVALLKKLASPLRIGT
jgi:aspartate dehydrogenase